METSLRIDMEYELTNGMILKVDDNIFSWWTEEKWKQIPSELGQSLIENLSK